MWQDADIQRWMKELSSFVTHMCMFDLHVPETDRKTRKLIRKSTRLLVSHADMQDHLCRRCPGTQDHEPHCHTPVAGSWPGVGSVSQHAGRYTKQFVQALLDATPRLSSAECLIVESEVPLWTAENAPCWEVLAARRSDLPVEPSRLRQALLKLHKNLGHPANGDLIRILRHGQASDEAVRAARELSCDFCTARKGPTAANPGQTHRVTEFNQRVGLDVKWLPGWKINQKVKALNLVDHASSFQLVLPFFEQETSETIRELYAQRWVQWAGPPSELVMDPARTNLGKQMLDPVEAEGTHVLITAAGAHWQLGKTEVHGGWFARVLEKVIEQTQPNTKTEWLECVRAAHVKNQMIQVYGFTPSQMVFGKNPSLPGDLLAEPSSVVANTASLTSDAIARAYAIRSQAKQAVLELQDLGSLRRALVARPRVTRDFRPGDIVAYWRDQKWQKGQLHVGGRWYGSAVVLGLIGRNVVVCHRTHIFRCAPEQVRFATTEERCLMETPDAQLLGIKDMIDGGTFRSSQYVDLLHESYPPQESDVLQQVSGTIPAPGTISHAPVPASSLTPPDPSPEASQPDAPAPHVPRPPGLDEAEPSVPRADESTGSSSSGQEVSPGPEGRASATRDGGVGTYGPVRRRVHGKDGELALFRPAPMKHDDFLETMREVVPGLVQGAVSDLKRQVSESPEQPAAKAARVEPSEEVLAVERVVGSVLPIPDCLELTRTLDAGQSIEVFIAQYMQKKTAKEYPPSNNPPEVQVRLDKAKVTEWQTLSGKDAVRIVPPWQADKIR